MPRILAEVALRGGVWLTTADAARMLQLSRQGVHYLAQSGGLAYERTLSGQRLFRYGVVQQVVEQRAAARVRRRGAYLAMVRTRMLKAVHDGEARQLTLDFSARLKLVGARGKGTKVA